MFLIFLVLLLLVISILISISLILLTRHKSRSQHPLIAQNNGRNQELAKNTKETRFWCFGLFPIQCGDRFSYGSCLYVSEFHRYMGNFCTSAEI